MFAFTLKHLAWSDDKPVGSLFYMTKNTIFVLNLKNQTMIKQLLFIASFFTLAFSANAQCVINTSLTSQGFYPDTLTNLPTANVGTAYSTDIQMRVPADTVIFGQTILIDSVHIDGLSGLPGSFMSMVNPISATTFGNGNMCMLISGTAVSGEELGGPNNDGIYPLVINYTSYITIPFIGSQSIPQTYTGYKLVVLSPVGLNDVSNTLNLITYPNPANANQIIEYTSANNENYALGIYNSMGQMVANKAGSVKEGVNKINVSTADLTNGMYFYSLKVGNAVFSKSILVQH